ncbi:Global transcription factor group E4, putative isoform 4 [Hibiscus syriacus]|uniref:Global transcription factor group E4, putative isoform 4 n=1 Tax=Hibiscus syriacus TaxID=106335 RepID=A0A6A2YWF8_HIBSY|nr:Global transcription factor group E4, putative isoform 4 [Hibiscus syriacus]
MMPWRQMICLVITSCGRVHGMLPMSLQLLASELEQVRGLLKKFEAKAGFSGGYLKENVDRCGGSSVRVNSDVGSVGLPSSRPFHGVSVSVAEHDQCNSGDVGGNGSKFVDKENRTPKTNQHHRKFVFVSEKEKLKPIESNKKTKPNVVKSNPGQMGGGIVMEKFSVCQPPLQGEIQVQHQFTQASAPARSSLPLEANTLEGSESMTMPVDPKARDAELAPTDMVAGSMKPKAKDPEKKDMTFEEKQRLSQEDEIEVDIGSVDPETLWELDRFMTNYKKSLSENKKTAEVALQGNAEDVHNIQETNSEPPAKEDSEAAGRIGHTSSPIHGKILQNEDSGSSSSSSDSGSSSSCKI